jgi:hypothetical protein
MKQKYLMKRVLLLFFILAVFFAKSFSQPKQTNKNKFIQAEVFVLYEEYKEALPLYMELLGTDPDNSNFKYRIGQCLINMPGSKQKAISYLEDAVKNINLKYKEGRFKETKAPYDAYYYLANAYRITNQLTKALDTYELFKKNIDSKVYDTTIVNLQILSCKNALEIMKIPIYLKKENLGDSINDRFSDFNPVVSADESVIVFNKATQYQVELNFSKKVNGKWSAPVNIISDLGLGFDDKNFATSISTDGRELYIYRPGADYDGNIYVTKRDKNDKWSNLIKLNDNINTKYWESHATISHNGKKLYFTSNRKGSYGGSLDIYVSERDSTGDWGPAKNLGPVINTRYNEESPFLGKDDKTLFFSSAGHFNIGGYDIFYSSLLDNGSWSVPLNVGYPLNTTDDDLFFYPVNDGYQAYYSIEDTGTLGLQDIYRIEIFSKDHPRKFFVQGIVRVKDLQNIFKDSVKVSAFNLEDPNAKVIVYSDPLTGKFEFELPQGKYSISYEASGAEKIIKDFDLALTNPTDNFVLPGTTLPKTDFVADMIIDKNKTLSVVKGETISFPVKAEANSVLTIEHWLGNSLLYTETHIIKDTLGYDYKTAPLTGNNRIVFKLTDKFNNTTSSEIFVKREKIITEQPVLRPEYTRVIAQKQQVAFVGLLKNNSDDNLKNLIERTGIDEQKFGRVDDIISFLKDEASRSNLSTAAIDKLALKVAVMNNILTQAAVDLMAKNTFGELKEILKGLNIYDANLKTWTDLQMYVSEKSNGKIQPGDLNKIAADIIDEIDTAISLIREKIIAYSDKALSGNLIKQSVNATDLKNIKKAELWVQSVYEESDKLGVKKAEMDDLMSKLTSLPNTDGAKFLEELIMQSDQKLKDYLNSPEFIKAGLKTPNEIISYLFRNKNKGYFPESSLFNALTNLISAKDISKENIASQKMIGLESNLWLLWVVIGAGVLLFFFAILRRKKSKEKK